MLLIIHVIQFTPITILYVQLSQYSVWKPCLILLPCNITVVIPVGYDYRLYSVRPSNVNHPPRIRISLSQQTFIRAVITICEIRAMLFINAVWVK